MDDTEDEAFAEYARKATWTLLGGSVAFGLLAVVLLVATVEDDSPARALAGLAGLAFALLSAMLFVLSRRARRASTRAPYA